MKRRLLGAGIGLVLILALIVIVFGPKNGVRTGASPKLKSAMELVSQGKLDEAKEKIGEFAEENPDSEITGNSYYKLAETYEKNGDIVKARNIYTLIMNGYQNIDNIYEVQEKLGELNIKILFSPVVTDKDITYEVQPGDTLSKIAKRIGTTVDLIKTSNSLESDTIRVGQRLKISRQKYRILVDKSQNLLTLLTDDYSIVKVYRVSTGENNSTPVGTFEVVNKIKNPVWYREGAVVPAESPENILGSCWLGLSATGYGVHGTIEPDSVGRQATKGCVRMLNHDVEELSTIVPVGIEVKIVD